MAGKKANTAMVTAMAVALSTEQAQALTPEQVDSLTPAIAPPEPVHSAAALAAITAGDAVDLVPMIRAEDRSAGGPVTANVHPDEVEAWKREGWAVKPADE